MADICPYCGSANIGCEYVDIGVGSVPCTPVGCYDCYASVLSHEQEPKSEEERQTGWARYIPYTTPPEEGR